MIDFLTGLALVGAAVSAIACAIAKLIIDNVECRIKESSIFDRERANPQFSIIHFPFSIHTAVFVFFAAIATLSAQKTNAPLRGASVELKMENVPAAANRLRRGYGGQVALAGEELRSGQSYNSTLSTFDSQ